MRTVATWAFGLIALVAVAGADDLPTDDLVQHATQAFREVDALQTAAEAFRVAGLNDLAREAAESAEQVKQTFVERLQTVQRSPPMPVAKAADQIQILCMIIRVGGDNLDATHEGMRILSGDRLADYELQVTRLVETGRARVLGKLPVVVLSGRSANFQLPADQLTPMSAIVSDKLQGKYEGVQVIATPTVFAKNQLRLRLLFESSAANPKPAIGPAGESAPAFHKQRMESTVELADGSALAVTGLKLGEDGLVLLIRLETIEPLSGPGDFEPRPFRLSVQPAPFLGPGAVPPTPPPGKGARPGPSRVPQY